ncbi:hypothetical protein SHKM778_71120 [Streptomyces sp. KM77-8]|uniref:isoleucine--tRNA ligase n=1 Tax=Streptomyces haneummycinicus TaxID=3074435 RepID=A0AAT9HTB2_9ACTN
MRGYHVARKAGWDCHGLPVELAVEKELGFSGKQDIEAYGIAEFNAKCRESVTRHTDAFEELTTRMGYWADLQDPYRTMDPEYIESVWWSLKEIFGKGLLVQDHRVAPGAPAAAPACPTTSWRRAMRRSSTRPSTSASRSPPARWPARPRSWCGRPPRGPWSPTLPSPPTRTSPTSSPRTARRSWSSPSRWWRGPRRGLGDHRAVLHRRRDGALDVPAPLRAGGVPRAGALRGERRVRHHRGRHGSGPPVPAFGEDDLKVCRAYGLPVVNPVRPDGTFEEDVPLVGGVFFKKADEKLTADLDERGLLFRHIPYEHSYPHCWRCHTALLYYAQPSWYIRTTAVKDRLLEENENTNWFPDSVKHGRYGDWLNNNIDWALSRNRYWGTPLPIWRCEDDHLTCVGSLTELTELTGSDQSGLDPHRPYIDEVTFACPQDGCAKTATRVPEVIDAWYDSGSMPFAQWGYPYKNKELFETRYPAQFICEAIDQTRGWFYTLMAIGTLVFDKSSYENVVCLGHILAEDGRKMSKHLGNILQPIPLMDQHGADAVRWFMAAGGSPGRPAGWATAPSRRSSARPC